MRSLRLALSSLAILAALVTPAPAQADAPDVPQLLTHADLPSAVLVAPAFAPDLADLLQTVAAVRTLVVRDTTATPQEFSPMRAKMQVSSVEKHSETSETVRFRAVSGTDPYGPNGESEDNTFARYTPSGDCSLQISNPDLIGKHEVGQKFYVDFTPAT